MAHANRPHLHVLRRHGKSAWAVETWNKHKCSLVKLTLLCDCLILPFKYLHCLARVLNGSCFVTQNNTRQWRFTKLLTNKSYCQWSCLIIKQMLKLRFSHQDAEEMHVTTTLWSWGMTEAWVSDHQTQKSVAMFSSSLKACQHGESQAELLLSQMLLKQGYWFGHSFLLLLFSRLLES